MSARHDTSYWHCPRCDFANDPERDYCWHCGMDCDDGALATPIHRCLRCGTEQSPGDDRCRQCERDSARSRQCGW